MGRNKIGLQVKGFEEYMAKLDELGGNKVMKQGVEDALIASKKYINPLIDKAVADSNLPAKGKYATGKIKESIDKDLTVNWAGMIASIDIGFDFKKSGMVSIYLMYGTPKMKPAKGLKEAIYGNKTQKEIAAIQGEVLDNLIKKVMEG